MVFQPRSTSPEKRESSPRRDSDHFYNDDEYFKSEVSHAETKSPTLPKKPPVSAAMKMEELNEFYEEFDGESILEYFDGEENDSHMLNETDSFYFYDDGQGMSLKSKKIFSKKSGKPYFSIELKLRFNEILNSRSAYGINKYKSGSRF